MGKSNRTFAHTVVFVISYYRLLLFIIVTQYFFALFHPQPKIRSYKPYKLYCIIVAN